MVQISKTHQMTKKEFLKTWKTEAAINLQFVKEKLSVLNNAQLNFKTNAESWSILQCVEHLNRYSEYYLRSIAGKLKEAKTKGSETVKYSWFGKMSIKAMHPDNRKKSQTLKRLNPKESEVNREVLNEFIQHQNHLIQLLEQAENHSLNANKIPADVFKLLRLRLGECFEFLIVHQQRHILQMKEIRKSYSME